MSAPNAIDGIKGFVSLPVAERFWEKVARSTPEACWYWVGTTKGSRRPYGIMWANGRHRPAPQISWEIANGIPFPSGMMACHTCDNPRCVNPAHIWPGTMSDNIKDAVAKGRHKSNSIAQRKRVMPTEVEKLRADVQRYRAALERIVNSKPHNFDHHVAVFQDIAREALNSSVDMDKNLAIETQVVTGAPYPTNSKVVGDADSATVVHGCFCRDVELGNTARCPIHGPADETDDGHERR